MKTTFLALACLALFAGFSIGDAQPSAAAHREHPWWRDRPFGPRFDSSQLKQLPLIRVQGNRFVDPDGKPVLFRGVSVADPDKLVREGHWNRHHFEEVKQMGATLVRIPVHPIAWRERTPRAYLRLLDQAVRWCTELKLYVDLDWHSIGNLKMELFQDPMYDTTQKETFEFWRTVAQHFNGNNTIAFYELFNEPTVYRGQLGSISWSDWKKLNEEMIRLIRAYDTNTVPLVAGFDWAYDLTPLRLQPINAPGIGYVTHPYPNKRSRPWVPKWEEDFGFAAAKYPVIATELGFSAPRGKVLKDDDYGPVIVKYLEGKGISWVAWCFDPEWGPTLLRAWNYDLTGSGEFFKEAMHRKNENAPESVAARP